MLGIIWGASATHAPQPHGSCGGRRVWTNSCARYIEQKCIQDSQAGQRNRWLTLCKVAGKEESVDAVTPEMPLDAPIAVSTSERKACYRGRNSISSQHRGRGPALSCIWDESLPTSFLTQILYTSQIHSVGSRQTQNIDQFFPKHRSTFQSQTKLIFHNLLMLILKYFFFEQSKEGTENERKVQRFPLCPLPPNMHSLPLSIPTPPQGSIC